MIIFRKLNELVHGPELSQSGRSFLLGLESLGGCHFWMNSELYSVIVQYSYLGDIFFIFDRNQ